MNMKTIALLALMWSPVAAGEEGCDVQTAAGQQWLDVSKASQNIANRNLHDVAAFEVLMDSREWDDRTSMIDQMSAEEASKFEKIRQAIETRRIASLIPSKRERDTAAISQMATIAEAIATEVFEMPADENSAELKLATILLAAREILPINAADTFPNAKSGNECNLISALNAAADESVKYASDYPFLSSAIDEVTRLNKIYSDFSKAGDKMSERDKKALLESRRIVFGANRYYELANDYLRLALLDETSQLLYEASMRDLFQNPGDIDAVGKTWQSWVEAGKANEEQVLAARLLFALNEQIPAAVVRDWEEIQQAAIGSSSRP